MSKKNNGFSLKSETENKVIVERLADAKSAMGYAGSVEVIETSQIDNWEYRDRKEFELGNIEELAYSIKNNGQAQPIVITNQNDVFKAQSNKEAKYVVIAGYRRWLACKSINIKVEAIVKEFSFRDAIACVVDENRKESVSDYSKGIFYSNILNSEKITQDDLAHKVGLTLSSIKNFISFSRIPSDIVNAINDMSKVSSRTSIEIVSLANKGDKYHKALIAIADKIKFGYGEKRIKQEVDKILNKKESVENKEKTIKSNDKILARISGRRINLDNNIIAKDNYDVFINDLEKLMIQYFG
ncbi:ParB/RepB/Spo0J family partition protein [Fastidiosibacter lacustris]|uniref:ParB/RepB/Spo0J family partition protein n=1 Tax=Fastidiosibacter lacustris TaxID=2056695 RepID=UPI000E3417CC|nr:ParB/RepB/Spo0J family partition protein [Fastidiosibacter lacustris]